MHLPLSFLGRAGHPHVPPDTTAQMGRHHVLLVGPATLIPLVRSALAIEGPHVDATDTAWLGRALAARYAYDLIVVDRPSDARGRALCGRIRAAGIATPILLLGTGATTGDTLVSGLAAGADDVLRKPVALATLRARLLALLHQRCRATVVVTDPREGASESDDLLVLTTQEYALLRYRVRQGGTTLQPNENAAVWGENVTRVSTEDRGTGHDRDDT